MRYVCIDFETNGFPTKSAAKCDWTLPFSNYPIQLSVDIVKNGEVVHAYDTLICGATGLAPWVRENAPINLGDLDQGKGFHEVLQDFADLLIDGDTIVAHNAKFDIETVIARAASKLNINTPALWKILAAPRFCTCNSSYSRAVFGRRPKLKELCDHFQVQLINAHDATADSKALADCVAEAVRRGVMLECPEALPLGWQKQDRCGT